MRNRKNSILTVLTLILALLLAACSPNEDPHESEPGSTDLTPTSPLMGTGAPAATPDGTAAGLPTQIETSQVQNTPTPNGPQPLWSRELKQAIAAAIDREAIVDRVFEGLGAPAYHMVPPGYPFSSRPFFTRYGTRDLDTAISLLSDLGYTADRPFEVDLWYPTEENNDILVQVMEIISEQLQDTGLIRVHLQTQPQDEFLIRVAEGQIPLFLRSWQSEFIDPHNWISPFASCGLSDQQGVSYCNPEMEELIGREVAASDNSQRGAVLARIGELYAEEVPTLPIYWQPEFMAVRRGVEGIGIGPSYILHYNGLSFTENALPAAKSPDTLTIGTTAQVNSLDPLQAVAPFEWEILYNTGLPLMRLEPGTANVLPGAAVDYPVVDDAGKVYTFTLPAGLQFSDGSPIDSRAFAGAWERVKEMDTRLANLGKLYVERVETPDELTVVFHLTGVFRFFPAVAASPIFMPVYPGGESSSSGAGSGAYVVAENTPGNRIILEANPEYAGESPPSIQRVVILYFPDSESLAEAIERGEIDLAWHTLGFEETFRLQNLDGITVHQITAPDLRYLAFNHNFLVEPGEP